MTITCTLQGSHDNHLYLTRITSKGHTQALYLVQRSPDVNGAVLYDDVHNFRNRSSKIGVSEFGMEKNLWPQEPLVANIDCEVLKEEGRHLWSFRGNLIKWVWLPA